MEENKREQIKKLAKPIQDFIASNSTIDKIEIEVNKIIIKSSEVEVINSRYHSVSSKDVPKHTFSCK